MHSDFSIVIFIIIVAPIYHLVFLIPPATLKFWRDKV